jgi:hypothetical protein
MVITEFPEHKIIIVCIYRSPDGKFDIFLNNLHLVTQKLTLKERILILSGDWNTNFFQESVKLNEQEKITLDV